MNRNYYFSTQRGGRCASIATTVIWVCRKCLRPESAQETLALTQPMIPAHDCSGLYVFAGTWQSPANL